MTTRRRGAKDSGGGMKAPFKEITTKLSVDETIKRLKSCLNYTEGLNKLDSSLQSNLLPVSRTLLSPHFKLHKNKEIQLLVACIQANIYRLYYPDSPHGEEQMKEVFSFFISQFEYLKKPSSFTYKWAFSLLEILSSSRLFTVCVNMDTQELLTELFEKIYTVINSGQSSQVYHFLLELMDTVIQESDQLSKPLLELILLPLLEPHKTNNAMGYRFSCDVIRRSSKYLESYIQMFYNSILLSEGGGGEDSSEDTLVDHIYELIPELYSIDGLLLLSVLPQLEWKLKVNDNDERLKVTTLLGEMFSSKGSQLYIENKSLWLCYLGRFHDISPVIRLQCIKHSHSLLLHHPHASRDIADKLLERLLDQDEKVRAESVKVVIETANEDVSCISNKLLDALQERMRDKKWSVRKYTITSLCHLYNKLMGTSQCKMLQWFPNKLLHSYYQPFPEDKCLIVKCFINFIVPHALGDRKSRMNRLLVVFNSLDDNSIKVFVEILKTQKRLRNHLCAVLDAIDNTDMKDEEKTKVTVIKSSAIAGCLPDPLKFHSSIREFVSFLNTDEELRHHLRTAVDVNSTCEEIIAAKKDISSLLTTNLNEVVPLLIDLCSPVLIDVECMKVLVKRVSKELCDPTLSNSEEEEKEEEQRCTNGLNMIRIFAESEKVWLCDEETLENILSLLRHNESFIVQQSLSIMKCMGSVLQERYNGVASCLQPLLVQFSLKGLPKIAKHSLLCLLSLSPDDSETVINKLFESLLSNLQSDNPHLLTTLTSLSQIARYKHEVFHPKNNKIVATFIIKELLDKFSPDDSVEECDNHNLWATDDTLTHDTRLKIVSMKLLVHWIMGFPTTSTDKRNERKKFAIQVFKLLTKTIADGGEIHNRGFVSPPERSRLRLVAAKCMLKLACYDSTLSETISSKQFRLLSQTVQDKCDEVREMFIDKLHVALMTFKLPLRYMSMFSLCGVESRKQVRINLKDKLTRIIDLRRQTYKANPKSCISSLLPEYSIPFVIYLMSHDDEFEVDDHKQLEKFRDCLWFYLEPLINKSANLHFLIKMIDSIKQLVDAEEPFNDELNKKIYAVCDLASGVLYGKIGKGSVGEFPGEVMLPKCLFVSRGKGSVPNDDKYLPSDFVVYPDKMNKIDAILKTPVPKRGRPSKKSADSSVVSETETTPSPVKKRRSTSSKKALVKQNKINFKPKPKNVPMTSTPITIETKQLPRKRLPTRMSSRLNVKRQVLDNVREEEEEEEKESQDVSLKESAASQQEVMEDASSQQEVMEDTPSQQEVMEDTPSQQEVMEVIPFQQETRRVSPRKRHNVMNGKEERSSKVPRVRKETKLEETTNMLDSSNLLIRKTKRKRK